MTSLTNYRLKERSTVTTWVLAGAFLALLGNFFRAQVLDHEEYRRRSETNRLRRLTLAAPRGLILDRNGEPIADNVPGFTVKLLAPSKDSLRALLGRMRQFVPLDDEQAAQVVRRFELAPYQPALVFGSTNGTTVARLEEHRWLLPGLVIRTEPRRLYSGGKAVAHVVGYVGEVSDADLAQARYAGARPGTAVGRDGLEAQYDSVVRGVDGQSFIEVDARGRLVRGEDEATSLRPVAGEAIRTTLDLGLQKFIDSIWTAERPTTRGSMIAMAPNGEILALYSAPAFDPNDFIGGISSQLWSQLNTDESKPLLNRALRGAYPPGSPFKLATASIALRRGVVGFDTHMPIPCSGGLRFGNRVFHCWRPAGHGSLDLTGAIANSCDVYFYQLGLRIGLSTLLEDATSMGFGQPTRVDLGSERSSFFPPSTAYYDRRYGPRGWSNAVTLNLAIGQGENDQSLINMMRFYAALAGDGTLPVPYLVRPAQSPRVSLGLTPEHLAGLRRALIAVVEHGTAAASGGRELNVAGKTGTAQNPHGQNHGWFIGFAPADHPQIVVGSIMEFAGHGTVVAPYVVRAIKRYLERGDPGLAKAKVKLQLQEDSAAPVTEVPADTLPRRR